MFYVSESTVGIIFHNLFLVISFMKYRWITPTISPGNICHIGQNLKDGNDDPICEIAKETQMYRTVFWTLGEDGGGMIWENSIETCILSYVKQITSPSLMHETGYSGLVHWDDPEGWDGEGGGKGLQDGGHMYTCDWSMSMYGKNHYNIVK